MSPEFAEAGGAGPRRYGALGKGADPLDPLRAPSSRGCSAHLGGSPRVGGDAHLGAGGKRQLLGTPPCPPPPPASAGFRGPPAGLEGTHTAQRGTRVALPVAGAWPSDVTTPPPRPRTASALAPQESLRRGRERQRGGTGRDGTCRGGGAAMDALKSAGRALLRSPSVHKPSWAGGRHKSETRRPAAPRSPPARTPLHPPSSCPASSRVSPPRTHCCPFWSLPFPPAPPLHPARSPRRFSVPPRTLFLLNSAPTALSSPRLSPPLHPPSRCPLGRSGWGICLSPSWGWELEPGGWLLSSRSWLPHTIDGPWASGRLAAAWRPPAVAGEWGDQPGCPLRRRGALSMAGAAGGCQPPRAPCHPAAGSHLVALLIGGD